MGLLEPHVGYRGGDGKIDLKPNDRAITVISLAQAETALAAAAALRVPVTLISAPDAAGATGPGWFGKVVALAQAQFPEVRVTAILDCGDAPGHALAAIRHGIKAIRFDGPADAQIADIAEQAGAVLFRKRPLALDLYDAENAGLDLMGACRDWLDQGSEATMLTEEMKQIFIDHSTGMVATIDEAGRPVVSPKATFVIVDDATIAFGNIRSPATLENIARRPEIEVCFMDVLTRKAVRVTGNARILEKATAPDALLKTFDAAWGDYLDLITAFVEIDITDVEIILSPAYDAGRTEAELRVANLVHLQGLS